MKGKVWNTKAKLLRVGHVHLCYLCSSAVLLCLLSPSEGKRQAGPGLPVNLNVRHFSLFFTRRVGITESVWLAWSKQSRQKGGCAWGWLLLRIRAVPGPIVSPERPQKERCLVWGGDRAGSGRSIWNQSHSWNLYSLLIHPAHPPYSQAHQGQ